MAEETEQTLLPIFPLAVVLVPGELLPLHIFEERYKMMMREALEGDRRFGLSFAGSAEVGGDAVPPVGSVGCVAQITAVVPLPGGRMNILTVGASRYVIRGYAQQEPYLIAQTVPLSDAPSDDPEIASLAEDVRQLFGRLADAARTLSNEGTDPPAIDATVAPEAISFLVAANIALDNDVKQEMLEMTDTLVRLERLDERLRELVETYEYRAEMHARSKTNGHGKKVPVMDEDEEE